MKDLRMKGSFTLPGESGYEELTLQLAKQWGADVIRDSDGTSLSEEILSAGYQIYSTICIIRDHNTWAKKHLDQLQQCLLITQPKVSINGSLSVFLLEDFFDLQFKINTSEESLKHWQVYDRTVNKEIDQSKWHFDRETGNVVITGVIPWHQYTVSFFVYRIWEEISMYNHTTNHWDKEHLMQLDPMYDDVQNYLLTWMENWCLAHKDTDVVRFTSLFYNFVWIWGSSQKNRYLFSDWGSYDFSVSPRALELFAERYGYTLTAEDFVNEGKYQVSHMPANQRKRDWMNFINGFVVDFGKKLVDIVHKHQKLAYVFYDDSWIGVEPYHVRFADFGFDGLIKCVFSGFEVRLCAGVPGLVHELRLHPYLFPVGLGGLPTFMEGGDPTHEAKKFWNNIRRALLRVPIERIGLGGYLHLVQDYPDFCEYIEKVAHEFRQIRQLHQEGKPAVVKTKIGILHSWGKIKSWTLSGHFHETYMHDLIHVLEALSGMPFDVSFIDFEDVKKDGLRAFDIIINAGSAGSAWSGGNHWKDTLVVDCLTQWVHQGGCFIGINQPSAVDGFDHSFKMAHVLGVDQETVSRVSHGKWQYSVEAINGLEIETTAIRRKNGIYLTDGQAQVLCEENGMPTLTVHEFGQGKGIYFSSFETNLESNYVLHKIFLYAGKELGSQKYWMDSCKAECAYYPASHCLVVINNTDEHVQTNVLTETGDIRLSLLPYETQMITL